MVFSHYNVTFMRARALIFFFHCSVSSTKNCVTHVRCSIYTCWMNEYNLEYCCSQEVWINFTEEELIELRKEGKVGVNLEEKGRSRTRMQAPGVWMDLISFIKISPGPVTYLVLSKYFLNEMNKWKSVWGRRDNMCSSQVREPIDFQERREGQCH